MSDNTVTPDAPQPPLTVRDTSSRPGWNLSSADIDKMVTGLRGAGVAEEAITAALKADGIEVPAKPGTDTRSEAEKAFDQSSLAPAASGSEYQVQWYSHPPIPTDELAAALNVPVADRIGFQQALDTGLRGAMAAMAMPREVGGALIELMCDSAARYSQLGSDAERSLYNRAARADAEAVLGPDATKDNQAVLGRLPAPLVTALANGGYLSDAKVLAQLALQNRRQSARDDLAKASK